jgi:hypothetical protein
MRSLSATWLCALLLISANGQAQLITAFGLKAGVVSANQNWDYRTLGEVQWDSRWGMDAGVFVEGLNLSMFSILAEFHYVQKGFSTSMKITTVTNPEGTGEERTFRPRVDYLSLPVLAKFSIDAGIITPYLFGGPRFDIPIGTSDDGISYFANKFKKGELGLSLGAGVNVLLGAGPSLLAELRYSPNVTESFSNNNLRVTNHTLEVLAGIRF